jgi:hypothetical protein
VNYVIFSKNCVTFLTGISCKFICPEFRPDSKSDTMNSNVRGYWNEKKEKLIQKFPTITNEDLSYLEGKEKEMLEILGYKLGKSKLELLDIIITL